MKDEDIDRRKNRPVFFQFGPLILWVGLIFIFIFSSYYSNKFQEVKPYSELMDLIREDRIQEVVLDDERIIAKLKESSKSVSGETSRTIISYPVKDEELIPLLKSKGIKFEGMPKSEFWNRFFLWIFPVLLIFFLLRNLWGSQGSRLLSLNKSRARLFVEKDIKTTFADVAGIDEAKEELQELVQFLKDPQSFSRLGGRAPKGVLLVGPPGTGKTLLARAVAGEASVPFYSINGSEFVELFVGMGASRVRDLFEQARKNSPCIIFIDELDALGKARTLSHFTTGNDEKEQTLNQLLAELDGFDPRSGVMLLAATNRPEVLDPALLRAGRFDRQVLVDKPDQRGRVKILAIHVKSIRLQKGVSLEDVASLTSGFSGADLANLVNEAALTATRRNASEVQMEDFVKAMERIVAGPERKQRIMNKEEKRRVAYHEMGHATVAMALQVQDQVQKVSIIPRGVGALGYTLQRPMEDRYLVTKSELENKIAMLLGGRVSELQYCGDLSTGAGDDLIKATNIARAMITQYGMGEVLGWMSEESTSSSFLPTPNALGPRVQSWSDSTTEKIDLEIKSLLERAQALAQKCINKNNLFLEECAKQLLTNETLEAQELTEKWNAQVKND